MKRYLMVYLRGHDGELEEDLEGDWVPYADAAELERQLAEERARLDWVIEQNMYVHKEQWRNTYGDNLGTPGQTAREAIDQERKA